MSSSRLSLSPDLRGPRTPPRKRKRKERKGRRWPTAPSNKVPEEPYYHLCADLAFLFWQKLSFLKKKKRGPTGRIRTPVSVCLCTRTQQRAALRATEGAAMSTARAQPAVRSLLCSRTPQPRNELPRRPHKEAHVAKGFAERRLLCTGSSPTAARRGPFPGLPPQPRSGLETRQSPRPAVPPAGEAAGPAAQPGAPGPTAAPRGPPPPLTRGPHLRGELQAARGFPGPGAAASRRL